MSGAVYVIVSGPPASGKSTLAGELGRTLGLPVVAKDTIKESLMDVLDVADVDDSRAVGHAAIAAMWAVARASSIGAVLDCNFRRRIAEPEIAAVSGRIVEVFCRSDREVTLERYRRRAAGRHAGHFDADRTDEDLWDREQVEPIAGGWPVIEVDTNRSADASETARLVRDALDREVALRVDHPALAVVAPHRLRPFYERIGVSAAGDVRANFTGWSKLVLLTEDAAVLVPRDHTQVDALRREVAVLEALTDLGVPDIPRLREVVEDDRISPYPIAVCDRLPGVPLADIVEDLEDQELGALFEALGRATARWHSLAVTSLGLPTRDSLAPVVQVSDDIAATPAERRASRWAADQARRLAPVVVHGDIHEGQLLVDPRLPHALTGVLDWQTARVDHPFADFDLGEWGTAMWRAHRGSFAMIRRRGWTAYACERQLPSDLGPVFEWFQVGSHLARRAGVVGFPVEHDPGVTGTIDEARHALRTVLATMKNATG